MPSLLPNFRHCLCRASPSCTIKLIHVSCLLPLSSVLVISTLSADSGNMPTRRRSVTVTAQARRRQPRMTLSQALTRICSRCSVMRVQSVSVLSACTYRTDSGGVGHFTHRQYELTTALPPWAQKIIGNKTSLTVSSTINTPQG